MGTRADFYVGDGPSAEWLGSIAFDGYPSGIEGDVLTSPSEQDFRSRVADMIASKSHGTKPSQGWPWPWTDSNTTDYAYSWLDGQIKASSFGGPWFCPVNERDPAEEDEEGEDDESKPEGPRPNFPDMSNIQNVTLGGRSGLIVLR